MKRRYARWWRASFDAEVGGGDAIDLRLRLAVNGRVITETWVYEYLPDADPIGASGH